MRHPTLALGVLACCVTTAACGKTDSAPNVDSAAAKPPAAAPAPAAAALSLADIAGKWNVRSVPEAGDTTPTNYVMTATADTTGWSLAFTNGLVVRPHVRVSGDSLIMDAGPYSSVRRKGVQVTTHGIFRRQGDKLVGSTDAHYKTTGADSTLRLRSEATRAK
ncbi:MAG: hypothetical protein M3081_16295 [Gemmatimonadota bacterium]|nr:hypothetical protein [Gemmatimonadota bacterium]